MDITRHYKACVKAAKAKGKIVSPNRILPQAKEKKICDESFDRRAAEVIRNISKLRDYLFSCQTSYLGEFCPLASISSKMTQDEREQIESDAQAVLTSCSNAISSLKNEVDSFRLDDQVKAHSSVVLDILDIYLKDICKLYSKQRAFRVSQAVEQKRMSRLKPDDRYIKEKEKEEMELRRRKKDKKDTSLTSFYKEHRDDDNGDTSTLINNSNITSNHLIGQDKKSIEEVQFSQEETQMFEEENERLYEEMNNIVKEVKNIEGKVVAIGKLQEIFQEKVLAQSDQIENVNETTVSTTENVKEGNEQIREAIKNSASFRVWILFFLVMCTFSLLFLDWYND